MIWWQWMVLGIVLLGAELMVDTQFYLVFLGASALLVGVIDVFFPGSPLWLEWVLFSVIAVAALLLFRARVYGALKGNTPDRGVGVVGEVGRVQARIDPGGVGKIELRGSTWSARNLGDRPLEPSTAARVMAVDGLTVEIMPEDV